MLKALKTLVPYAEATKEALVKLSESVAFKLPDDGFFSKGGDDGEAMRKSWAKDWVRKVTAPDDVDDVEAYEAERTSFPSLCSCRREDDAVPALL